jgi:uncharacterized RDD family membrane protein YckC
MNFNLADKGARIGNCVIDVVLIGIIVISLVYLVFQFYPEINNPDSIALEILYLLSFAFYYFFFELVFQKTPGKFLTKTRVVDNHGNNPTAARLALRTLIRFVPFEGLSFLFGTTGLHDVLSKTKVVKDKS